MLLGLENVEGKIKFATDVILSGFQWQFDLEYLDDILILLNS